MTAVQRRLVLARLTEFVMVTLAEFHCSIYAKLLPHTGWHVYTFSLDIRPTRTW